MTISNELDENVPNDLYPLLDTYGEFSSEESYQRVLKEIQQ